MKRLLVVATLAACSHGSTPDQVPASALEPPKDAIVKVTENGPVKATIKVWPAKPRLGDEIYLRLVIDAAAGVAIDPPFQETGARELGRFDVPDWTHDVKRLPDGGQRFEQTYTLEASSSGKQRIPPFRFEMTDGRAAPGSGKEVPKPQELLTEEIPIDIAPVPPAATSAEMHAASGALDPDIGGVPWTLVIGIASIAAVIGSGSVLAFRAWRARRKIAAQRSAYDEAVARLRALGDRGAPGEAEADAWFVDLSGIVRAYLERRYDIRAPELTTEEFLQEMSRAGELTSEHRGMLTAFLERCDQVKFAGYRPESSESLASLESARGFVEDTRMREAAAA